MVDYLPNTHFLQIVLELFAAVQANDIALAVRLARLSDRRDGAGKAAVGATEQQVQYSVDHLEPPLSGPAASFPLWQTAGAGCCALAIGLGTSRPNCSRLAWPGFRP